MDVCPRKRTHDGFQGAQIELDSNGLPEDGYIGQSKGMKTDIEVCYGAVRAIIATPS